MEQKKIPTRVFFLGAGASKSCGLPLASELYDVLKNPEKHNINFSRSNHPTLQDIFESKRKESLFIIDTLSKDAENGLSKLEATFNILTAIRLGHVVRQNLSKEDATYFFRSLCFCFDIILHPTYNTNSRSACYLDFSYKIIEQPGWSTIISTNWDYLLDVHLDCAAGHNILIDWGVGSPNVQFWTAAIELMAQYSWEIENKPFISFYKPNGSVGWYHCENDKQIFALNFYDPYNLHIVRQKNEIKRLNSSMAETGNSQIIDLFACPKCEKPMYADALHVPGISRKQHPLYDIMFINIRKAVMLCDEIVFIGYSCPSEDADLIAFISEALKENDKLNNRKIIPKVVDIKGAHNKGLIEKYKKNLNRNIDFYDQGFLEWMKSLP